MGGSTFRETWSRRRRTSRRPRRSSVSASHRTWLPFWRMRRWRSCSTACCGPSAQVIAVLAPTFRLLAHPAIAAVNLLNHFGALLVLDAQGPLAAFSGAQREGLASAWPWNCTVTGT